MLFILRKAVCFPQLFGLHWAVWLCASEEVELKTVWVTIFPLGAFAASQFPEDIRQRATRRSLSPGSVRFVNSRAGMSYPGAGKDVSNATWVLSWTRQWWTKPQFCFVASDFSLMMFSVFIQRNPWLESNSGVANRPQPGGSERLVALWRMSLAYWDAASASTGKIVTQD